MQRDRSVVLPSPTATGTRERIVIAAMVTILERGIYRATSNEIARTSGLTWGAIQRQFGSREALMFAVFEREWHHLLDTQRLAHIEGDLARRVRCLLDELGRHYGRPEALVGMTIASELRKDPATSAQTRDAIRALAAESETFGRSLMARVLGEHDPDRTMARFVYMAVRDFHLGIHLEDAMAPAATMRRRRTHLEEEKVLLVRALVAAIKSG